MFESLKRISLGALITSCVFVVVYLFGVFRHYLEAKFNGGKEFSFVTSGRFREWTYKPDIDYSLSNTFMDGIITMITIAFGILVMFLIIAVFYSIGEDFLKKRGDGNTQESIGLMPFMILMMAVCAGVWVALLVYSVLR